MTTTLIASPTVFPKDLTPSSLLRIADQLLPGEKLIVSRLTDGTLSFSVNKISGDTRTRHQLDNMMEGMLKYQPVKPGWMSYIEVPSDERASEIRKVAKEKRSIASKRVSEKELEFGLLAIAIFFKDASDFTRIKFQLTEYLVTHIGDKVVFCKLVDGSYVPVMYKVGENGRLIYK